MLNLKSSIADDILKGIQAAQEAGDLPVIEKDFKVVVNHSIESEHGDYSSPVALTLTKMTKKPPLEIIAAIVEHMPKKEYVGKLEGVEPGFLNVRLNPGWMTARLDDVIEQNICGSIDIGKKRRYNFEFISANPTGPLTLGNARTAFSVDTLAKVLTCAGFNVTREYYVNDAGGQILKLGESTIRRALQQRGEEVEYGDDLYQGEYIQELATNIAEELRENEGKQFTSDDLEDKELLLRVGQQVASILLAQISKTVSEDLKIDFDVWTSEKELRQSGIIEESVDKIRKAGKTYKKDGVEYLKTTDYGDGEDRVLVKSNGEYAYIAPDIGYHQNKYDRKFDGIFTFVGADHQGHAPKLMAAMDMLGNDTSKLKIVTAQWMRLVENGKPVTLSKRKGEIYTPRELIEEVGYDAARFFMLQHALTTHMDFDIGIAKERNEKNPVYYIQYAHVRLQSIMRKAKESGVIKNIGDQVVLTSHARLTHTAEINLMKELYRLPEVIGDVADDFQVQALAYYAKSLAKSIHVFYRNVPVVKADKALIEGRLQLVIAARKVIAQVLDLLGIDKPDVM